MTDPSIPIDVESTLDTSRFDGTDPDNANVDDVGFDDGGGDGPDPFPPPEPEPLPPGPPDDDDGGGGGGPAAAERHAYDCSAGVPSGAGARAKGYESAVRYLPKNGSSSVHVIGHHEFVDLTNHGISVALVYEAPSGARAGAGHAAGVSDAKFALGKAREVVATEPRCVYMAVDFDAEPSAVVPYFQGAKSVLGSACGAYGSFRVLDRLLNDGLISFGWQTAAWSKGQLRQGIALYQRVGAHDIDGVTVDLDVICRNDFGQHPAPFGSRPMIVTEDDVTDEDKRDIVRKVLEALDNAADKTLEGQPTTGTRFIDGVAKRVEQFRKNPDA